MLRFLSTAALSVAAALLALACASTNFDGTVFRNDDLAFRVGPVPSEWQPVQTEAALLAFRDDRGGATIAVNGRCGQDGDDVPLQALTHHLFLHFTERQVISQQIVTMDGREALRTEIIAALDGVPKRYTVYVLKKDGCVFDFLHISARAAPADSRASFERFVQGFHTMS
jgi:hypothetical protein